MTLEDITTIGRYECPACDSRFSTLSEKKAHIRGNHPR